jgi:hypothetical protein
LRLLAAGTIVSKTELSTKSMLPRGRAPASLGSDILDGVKIFLHRLSLV